MEDVGVGECRGGRSGRDDDGDDDGGCNDEAVVVPAAVALILRQENIREWQIKMRVLLVVERVIDESIDIQRLVNISAPDMRHL